ncbi:hypothetical protein [Ligilactobacillus aviarius]|uniref:hypothetical protein n=1 Tax=Ligilactobacillus aviarius TaxID=1606 RepID=UPI00249F8B6C|nr:hypothetical protein [Ligilactobacillus aviarius]
MAAIHSDILTLTINETPVDLTAFIDLNKTTLLSDHHGRCIVFNVRPPQEIKEQLKDVPDLDAIDFNVRLNYFTEIPGIYKSNYELIVFRVFTGAQTAINVVYYDRARTFSGDLAYWKQRLAIRPVVYQSYSTARVCTFYPPTLTFKYQNQVYVGKCIENPGKGKYRFFADDGKKIVTPYSRSVEAYEFRKHLNLLGYQH